MWQKPRQLNMLRIHYLAAQIFCKWLYFFNVENHDELNRHGMSKKCKPILVSFHLNRRVICLHFGYRILTGFFLCNIADSMKTSMINLNSLWLIQAFIRTFEQIYFFEWFFKLSAFVCLWLGFFLRSISLMFIVSIVFFLSK